MAFEDQIEEAYKVVIRADVQDTPSWFKRRIVASVPEDGFSISTNSQWEAPLESGGDALNTFLQLGGFEQSTRIKPLSLHIWQGVDPVEVSIPLRFMTHSSPYNDVVRPAMSLDILPLPSMGSRDGYQKWFLNPPIVRGRDSLKIAISGRSFVFQKALPVNADLTFSGTYCREPNTNETWPVSADVDFTFIASEAPVREMQQSGIQIGTTGNRSTSIEGPGAGAG